MGIAHGSSSREKPNPLPSYRLLGDAISCPDENYLGLIQLACGLLCSGIAGYTDSRPQDGIEIVS
jgi:hypothetical protein